MDMKAANSRDGSREAFRSLKYLIGSQKTGFVSTVVVASLLSGAEGVLHPLLVKAIFDEAVYRGSFSHFVGLILGYLALGVFLNVTGFGLSLWTQKIDNRILHQVSKRLLASFFRKKYKDILSNGEGYYVSRIHSDVQDGLMPMLQLVRSLMMDAVRLVALFSVLIIISWKAFVILFALIPISSVASKIIGKKIREYTTIERDQEAQVLSSLAKYINAFKLITGFHLVGKTLDSYDTKVGDVLGSQYKKYRVIQLLQGTNDLTMVFSDFLSLFVGAYFVFRKMMTFGSYLAFTTAFWRSATTLMQIFSKWANFHSLGVIVTRVSNFVNEVGDEDYYSKGDALSASGLSFSYAHSEILTNFSMGLSKGERVLVLGSNGSGKTTLANIFSGLLSPSSGDVVLPERISSITLPIALPPVLVEELEIDAVLLDRFGLGGAEIAASKADELSMGQQQKIALSLALSKEADLYILDEPLSSLDVDSRPLAIEAIMERTKGKMAIVIMHGDSEYHGAFDRTVQL